MTISRRGLITGLVSFAVTAPAIVKVSSLMPVKVMEPSHYFGWDFGSGDRSVFYEIHDGDRVWIEGTVYRMRVSARQVARELMAASEVENPDDLLEGEIGSYQGIRFVE